MSVGWAGWRLSCRVLAQGAPHHPRAGAARGTSPHPRAAALAPQRKPWPGRGQVGELHMPATLLPRTVATSCPHQALARRLTLHVGLSGGSRPLLCRGMESPGGPGLSGTPGDLPLLL
ncbi:hypothetical protein P7K49_012036 [Saguinus oedipus]|uniref:Uncharacterized protein n=1 Tax=Saguinus oedipus TaxID=9490 RepID=A0ABQ9VSD1_SAGOE|nr:hypothetical protein P7K49_012036 [Saguinus oedipus]